MDEFLKIALAGMFSGGVFVAIIEVVKESIAFRRKRKAEKEDKAAAKIEQAEAEEKKKTDERLDRLEEQNKAIIDGLRVMLLDRVLYLGQSYIDKGEITYDERHRFHQMHDCYHTGLGGNGDADLIVEAVDELPPKR